jgi:hypothetical protein
VGFYKFTIPAQDVCGSIDGGAALPAADRYIRDMLVGPSDGYLNASVAAIPTNPLLTTDARLNNLDATISSRSTYAGGAVASVTAAVTVGTNNDKTGYALSTAGVQAIWDVLTSALTTVGSIGKKLADWVVGTIDTYTGNTKQTGDGFARLGAPAGVSVSADVAAIQADTDNIQTRLPAALVGGKMDSTTTLGTDSITALVLAADAVSEIATSVRSGITTDHGAGAYGAGVAGANNVTLTLLNATAAAQTITAATKANPCQLTIAGHGRSNGDKAVIAGVGGMVELNNRLVTVTVVDADNVTIGVDSTGFTTYTSGGTITKTDEAAIQSAHLTIMDATNTNMYATAETNASGVSVQGSNSYVAMDSGNYVLRPTRSLLNATGTYSFNVSATGTKYFVATALTIPVSGNPDTQVLSGTHTKGGRIVKAVARPGQTLPTPAYTIDTEKTETTTAAVAPHTWSLILYRGITYDIVFDKWDKKTITITSASGAEFTTY